MAGGAFDADVASEVAGGGGTGGEADAGAGDAGSAGGGAAGEFFEDEFLFFAGDAGAVVGDFDEDFGLRNWPPAAAIARRFAAQTRARSALNPHSAFRIPHSPWW